MRIYALVNQKGGVGKTTTAINLGANLALRGLRVLIVDLDPQANATACLGIAAEHITRSSYEALIGGVPISDCVMHSPKLGLALVPSSPSLAGAQIELIDLTDRETALRRAIEPLDGRFDYVLIDCPPSLGLLTVNGLVAAAGGVIIPVQCEYLALEGLTQLMRTLQRVRSSLFPALSVRGLLATMYDVRTRLSQEVVEELRGHFGSSVFQTVIPRSVRLAEAPSHGLPISAYSPNSSGGQAYRALADELLRGDGARTAVSGVQPVAEAGAGKQVPDEAAYGA